jgi:hypothetical protein
MPVKTVPEIHAEAERFLAEVPPEAVRQGSALGRWELKVEGLTVADGEAGRGVYFFFAQDRPMSAHYAGRDAGARRLAQITLPPGGLLIDLTHPKVVGRVCQILTDYATACGSPCKWSRRAFQRSFWGLTLLSTIMAEKSPAVAGYVVPHVIPSCPASRQVVVFRTEALNQAD